MYTTTPTASWVESFTRPSIHKKFFPIPDLNEIWHVDKTVCLYGRDTIASTVRVSMYSVDEMQQLLTDDDKLQEMLASRIDEVNDVQQKVVLFLEKFASKCSVHVFNPVTCDYRICCIFSDVNVATRYRAKTKNKAFGAKSVDQGKGVKGSAALSTKICSKIVHRCKPQGYLN